VIDHGRTGIALDPSTTPARYSGMVGYQRVVRITMRCTLTAFLLALLLMAEQEARAEPKVITLCDRTVTDTTTTSLSIDRQPQPIEKMGVVANLNERTATAVQIGARFDCELERMSAKLESAQVSALLRAAQQGDKKAAVKLQRRIRRLSDGG
jgi:hypothetical protein